MIGGVVELVNQMKHPIAISESEEMVYFAVALKLPSHLKHSSVLAVKF